MQSSDTHIIQLYANNDTYLARLVVERDGFYYYIKIGGLTVHGAPGLPDALECNDSGFWHATSNPSKPLLGTVQVDTTHTGPTKITLLDIDTDPKRSG